MKAQAPYAAIVFWFVGAVSGTPASALNDRTHELVNDEAARQSEVDQVLKTRLGFANGIDTAFLGKTVVRWLRDGGIDEDRPLCRPARHFHDPLKPWEQAGLSTGNVLIGARCGTSFPSSLVWAQTDGQDPAGSLGGNRSWQDARRHYAEALRTGDPGEWAETFLTLGHLMHLVVDASVPEHVRNDIHVLETILRAIGLHGFGSYEHWVSDQHTVATEEENFISRYLANAIAPDHSVLTQATGDPNIRIPIARLLDTNRYDGTDPNVTVTGPIGIAEVANANFLTADSVNQYPFPRFGALVSVDDITPSATRVRRYFRKADGDGFPVSPVLAECALDETAVAAGIPPGSLVKCEDANVWKRVAEAMLPRAVGYSAALLDYFFRGRLRAFLSLQKDAIGIHATIFVVNQSDEPMDGTVEIYGETEEGTRWPIGSGPVALAPGASTLLRISPLPADAAPPPWVIVFKGRLGEEPDAVAAGRVGAGVSLVSVARNRFPGSECLGPPITFDGSFVAPGLSLPVFVFPSKHDGAYVPHQTAFYDCNENGGVIVEPAESELRTLVYRTSLDSPGNTVTVSLPSGLAQCGLSELGGGFIPGTRFPVSVEVVELATPSLLSDFYRYTLAAPPPVRRPLGVVADGQTAAFDVGDARFFGFRVVEAPPAAILGPVFVPYDTQQVTRSNAAPGLCFTLPTMSIEQR